MIAIALEPHPLLDAAAFATDFRKPLPDVHTSERIASLLARRGTAPLTADDAVRAAVRDLLRHGGYKPTGRGKPASEYLVRAANDGTLAPINAAVDACNAVSLHSGLPISVVDLDRATAPFRIAIAAGGTKYVFNASGQEIDVSGLVCLFDALGACANAVKDSQRTKTNAQTRRTLSIVWGTRSLDGRAAATATWYRELLHDLGAATEAAELGAV